MSFPPRHLSLPVFLVAVLSLTLPGSVKPPVLPSSANDRALSPAALPPVTMIRARGEVQTEAVWAALDREGIGITGKGVLLCDIEGPPDIFHPLFFRLDGGRFSWIDLDGNGTWSPGDAVDVDRNGVAGADEELGWIRLNGDGLDRDTTRFITDLDFLFQDQDRSGKREFGPPRFAETDPSLGERLFIADDRNGNLALDAGEDLIGLGTSKVRAISTRFAVYRRGVNLMEGGGGSSHATSVAGILLGGWPGRHRLTGIAPDAEILGAEVGPGLLIGEAVAQLHWAREEGADIVLWEVAGPFSDGTHELDRVVNELCREGMIFIGPAGNERLLWQHVTIHGQEPRTFLGSRGGLSFVFPDDVPGQLEVTMPDSSRLVLSTSTGISTGLPGWSLRGELNPTFGEIPAFDLSFRRWASNDHPGNVWRFRFPGFTGTAHGYTRVSLDDVWIPEGLVDRDGKYTVTSPGVADSSITVGAYDNDPTGRIAWFSGEGPRWDGRPVVDIAAPGVRVLAPGRLPQVIPFEGTSAAVPFVAGAAALLKQAFPDLDSGTCRALLRAGAATDSLTGDADHWGAGRLRIHGSLAAGLDRETRSAFPGRLTPVARPNPSSETTQIGWESPDAGTAAVRVFSVTGRLVWQRSVAASPGSSFVEWNGTDRRGVSVPAGVYFGHVRQGSRFGVIRIVRVR